MLDIRQHRDSVYGGQEQSAYNKHYESTCYHPLLLFNSGATALPRNCCWATFTVPMVGNTPAARDRTTTEAGQGSLVLWADAAFAKPEIYEALEERGAKYAIRIPANDCLMRDIEELLTRPVGRPAHKPVVWYKASSIRQLVGGRRGG